MRRLCIRKSLPNVRTLSGISSAIVSQTRNDSRCSLSYCIYSSLNQSEFDMVNMGRMIIFPEKCYLCTEITDLLV